jgi:hypothetical protein
MIARNMDTEVNSMSLFLIKDMKLTTHYSRGPVVGIDIRDDTFMMEASLPASKSPKVHERHPKLSPSRNMSNVL